MAFEFTKDLETGNTLIDTEHRQLFNAINALLDACSKGQGRAKLGETADFLVQYTAKHFSDEEQLQARHGYPDYPRHRKLHADFKHTVQDLAARLKATGATVALVGEVNTKVGGWLVHHVKGEDKKVAEYIRSRS